MQGAACMHVGVCVASVGLFQCNLLISSYLHDWYLIVVQNALIHFHM